MNEEFSKIFDRLIKQAAQFKDNTNSNTVEKYVPTGTTKEAPIYKPLRIGPRPITVKVYLDRQQKFKQLKEKSAEQAPQNKRKTSAGKQVRIQRQITELYRIIPLTRGKVKKNLIEKLQSLKTLKYQKRWVKKHQKQI